MNEKPDLDCAQHIKLFVDAFYSRMLKDEQLAPIFLDVAEIELAQHLPLIRSYWEKLLLGDSDYNRHTMNIHRAVHAKQALKSSDFDRWLHLFTTTVDRSFSGQGADKSKRIASSIVTNMQNSLI